MVKTSNLPQDNSPTTDDYAVAYDPGGAKTARFSLSSLITLFFNNIPNNVITGANVDWTATGADAGMWWEELGRDSLTLAGDVLTVSNLPVRRYLKIVVSVSDTGGTIGTNLQLNNDSTTSYAVRYSDNGGADSTATAQASILFRGATTSAPMQTVGYLYNIQNDEKVVQFTASCSGNTGSGNVPARVEGSGKWANTSDYVTRIDVLNVGTGDFAIGSQLIILGHD